MQFTRPLVFATIGALALAACSAEPEQTSASGTVTVVTHDSFAVPDDVLAAFEEESGLTLEFVAPGDAGALVNQLILTQGAPLGDVVYGVDNTFASRAVDEGVFEEYVPEGIDASVAEFGLRPGELNWLTPIDFSDVCLNIDDGWFAENGVTPPTTLTDLTDPTYAGLLSAPNPATSSPGLAFLLATVASRGDDWPQYWEDLAANDLRVTAGWSDTYYTDFSAPSAGGDYPIVVSYASSPPFEELEDGTVPTSALLDTCFRQIEYAGVLSGAQNPAGARAVIDWMSSDAFQETVPENMYVYPVSPTAELPANWVEHAPLADSPYTLDAATIDENREAWIQQWTEIVLD